jgi:mannitol/fructose-specific phosphotransferase system IIA component (Ntr-type)
MTLSDMLQPENIIPDMKARDRWEAIDELIAQLVATGTLRKEDQEAIAGVVRKREHSMSTGIGFGVGIPHASTNLISDVAAAFGRSKQGIEFEALDAQPVTLVVLFLVPQGMFQKHLHTLARIAKMLHQRKIREALEQAPDREAIAAIIREQGTEL